MLSIIYANYYINYIHICVIYGNSLAYGIIVNVLTLLDPDLHIKFLTYYNNN